MTVQDVDAELIEAIATAELTDEEGAKVRELVEGGGVIQAAIEFVLGEREPADDDESGENPPPAKVEPGFVVDDAKVEKEIDRHLNAMLKLLGPTAANYTPCEACGAAGVVEPSEQMQTNDNYRACPTCAGHGKVLTGSKDPTWAAQPCPTCAGRGFLERVPDAPAPQPITGEQPAAGGTFERPAWMGDTAIKPTGAPEGWR